MIRLLVTYKEKGHIRQQNYNCQGMEEAFLRFDKERGKPTCLRIEVLHLVEDWRRDHG